MPTLPPPSALLAPVLDTVRASGHIIRENWHKPRQVRHKGAIDLVTETDLAVEDFLTENLRRITPHAAFLAEETAAGLDMGRGTPDVLAHGDCWIIDPVDGTTNFVHGIPVVATSVALWRAKPDTGQGRVVLGVVNLPLLGECCHAVYGQGAWLAAGAAPPGRMQVSPATRLDEAVVGTGFPYDVPRWQEQILGWLSEVLPRAQGVRRLGAAAADLAFVAAGRLDAFYEASLKPWDVAAGWLLVEEAGGRVSNLAGEGYALGQDVLVASNGKVHGPLLAALAAPA